MKKLKNTESAQLCGPKHTKVRIDVNYFLSINGQFKVKLADFYFCALGANG